MYNDNSWLGKKEELEYGKLKFTGAAAGKAWKYSQSIDGIIRTRALIFLMSILVLYPVVSNYLFYDLFSRELLFERLMFSMFLLVAGFLFNRYRLLSILIAVIPIAIILLTYLTIAGRFDIRKIGFLAAVLLLILSGIYYDFKSRRLKEELDKHLVENHLIVD